MSARESPWKSAEAYRTYVSGSLWALGTLLSLVRFLPHEAEWLGHRLDVPDIFLIAAAIVGGWNFFPKGVRAAATLRLDMNFLMTAAILGALVIGEFVEAGAIAFLFSLAELLEHGAIERARRSIDDLLRLSPERASRIGPDGSEVLVRTEELKVGDLVRVRPGEKIPIDGRVVAGSAAVDESSVTGESVPVGKGVSDLVYAGTMIYTGSLDLRATTDAGDTTLARIVRLVREAQAKRAPIEHFVQRFARVYTPAVTALALSVMIIPPLVTDAAWLEWFVRGLTLLVIACPCALVIATPVTIVSGLTGAARHGVLVKSGEYLEGLGSICAFAFDKTGTLTEGKLEIMRVVGLDARPAGEVLALAAAVESRSEHPIGKAIVARARTVGVGIPEVSAFRSEPGRGVAGDVDDARVRVGTPAFLSLASVPPVAEDLERRGWTVVIVEREARIVGLIALADRPRPAAREAIAALRRRGIHHVVMLTGDHDTVARAVAAETGVDEVRAGLSPADKVEAIRELREGHRGVVMVGDGVNDAPALATATVGVAMGAAGSPAAIETADVALMADDLAMLPYAVSLAQRARKVVRFNIAAAILIKSALAVGAVAGWASLIVAVVVGDMGASLLITLNAARLGRAAPPGRGGFA
ncbi:MAG: cation-translocating P-type ATPase [Chloroflexi bacterium]|nr:cation-translocating P-type ATPase [Chloroflexota bacterium]